MLSVGLSAIQKRGGRIFELRDKAGGDEVRAYGKTVKDDRFATPVKSDLRASDSTNYIARKQVNYKREGSI